MKYLKFNEAQFLRASAAWCPMTGKAHKPYEPRVVENFIQESAVAPRIYHRFEASQGFTAYNRDASCFRIEGETTDYLEDWLDVLEACNPSVERLLLGQSYEGRDIEAFRLGPPDRQHFVIDCVIHGNESDGLPGTLKAFELLLTHPDFARLRAEYTLFLIPCCNPDGFYFGTRNLRKLGPHPSGVPTGINLNRVWPWFWDEFTPTGDESKGAVPLDCPEAQAMYLWRTEGNSGQPTPIRFLMDQHSTAGDGARYQSRDRNFKEITEYDWFSCWADYIIYRHMKAVQTKRVWEDGDPDLFINYFRSRYVPHWHTWNANRLRSENGGVHPIVMVNEYNKVAYVTVDSDPETYQSACNYTFDYAISCALVMQSGFVQPRDAVLIENTAGTPSINSFNNPAFTDWQEKSDELDTLAYRPSYWSTGRADVIESSHEDRQIEYQGRPFTVLPNLKLTLPAGTSVGPTDIHDLFMFDVYPNEYRMDIVAVVDTGGFSFCTWSLGSTLVEQGRDLVADNTQQLRLAGMYSSSDPSYVLLGSESTGISFVTADLPMATRVVLATYPTARMNAATAWDTDSSGRCLYILGGETTAGVYTQTILKAKTPSLGVGTIVELGTNLLTTANSGGEAIFCSGGSLDGKVVMVGGKVYHATDLRVVTFDPATLAVTESLIDLSDTTLPRKLVSCALSYDGDDTIWIYGGEDPDTGLVHQGVWTIRWHSSAWTVEDKTLSADPGDDGDPEDYGGSSTWNRYWSRWRAARSTDTDTGVTYVLLLGGMEQDPATGLPLPGPYDGAFLHDTTDDTLTRPEDQNYGYYRTNIHYDVLGFDKLSTSFSFKAEPSTTTGYVRINNATGESPLPSEDPEEITYGDITVRRCRTYYMHPPRWWWREHACLDLLGGDPTRIEDEVRMYVRVYQDAQSIATDAPMLHLGTLWPYSWVPSGVMRSAEEIQWNECLDPKWFHVSLTFQPQASYLCLESDLVLLRIVGAGPSTSYLTVSFVTGDAQARTYVRDQVHGIVEPAIRLTVYDSVRGTQTCDIPLFWGGYAKDTARGRFDTPIKIDVWQHATYGCGLIVDNAGAIGKNYIRGALDKSLWPAPGYLTIVSGGWWAEPILYELTDEWVKYEARKQEPTKALVLGDRDPTFGQVSQRSTFRYVERFTRSDDINLGDFWDVITQTGNGWNIASSRARCDGVGWERWDAYPYLRDVSVMGEVVIANADSRVGFFTRIHWGQAGTASGVSMSYAHGYLGTLAVDSGGNATLEIEHVYRYLDMQSRDLLVSVPCAYTLLSTVTLEFEAVGSTLTLIARTAADSSLFISNALTSVTNNIEDRTYYDVPDLPEIARCTVVDTNHILPGAFGICGETTSSSRYVYIDSVRAEPRGGNVLRITD
jgi:hypothetical protein